MDSTTIKYFITVAKTQHITKAARQLNITQPSLSAAMHRLEAELGFPLFDHVGRNIQLNEYGKLFLYSVLEADKIMTDCLADIDARRQHSASFIRLNCSNSSTNNLLIDFLIAKGQNLKIDAISDAWEEKLLNRECDLVITMDRARNPETHSTVLRQQEMVIAAGTSHPLASKEEIFIRDIAKYPFCSTSSSHSLLNISKEQLNLYRLFPCVTFWGRDSKDMITALCSGKYLSLMVLRNLPENKSITVLKVQDFELTMPIYLHRRADLSAQFSAVYQDIVDFYRLNKSSVSISPVQDK